MSGSRRGLVPVLDPDSGFALGDISHRGGTYVDAVYGVPLTVRVRGLDYRVRFHTNIYTDRGESLLGCCSVEHRLILVQPCQPRHEVLEVLGHEVAHVYLHEAQKSDPRLRRLKPDQVEAFCDLFAEAHLDLRDQVRGG